jgi:hypothetical protein
MKKLTQKYWLMFSVALFGMLSSTMASAQGITAYITGLNLGAQGCQTAGIAGTAADPFVSFMCMMFNWSNGSMAIGLSIVALVFGIFGGIAKSTIMPVFIALGIALAFNFGPDLISFIVTGTELPVVMI